MVWEPTALRAVTLTEASVSADLSLQAGVVIAVWPSTTPCLPLGAPVRWTFWNFCTNIWC